MTFTDDQIIENARICQCKSLIVGAQVSQYDPVASLWYAFNIFRPKYQSPFTVAVVPTDKNWGCCAKDDISVSVLCLRRV